MDVDTLTFNNLDDNASTETAEVDYSDFAKKFVEENVAEPDREIFLKYVKPWDANVTKEFQSRAEKLKPWESLGEPIERVQQAINILRSAEQDPVGFYNYVKDTLTDMEYDIGGGDTPTNTTDKSPLPEYEGLPEGFLKEFNEIKGALKEVADFVGSQKQLTEEQKQQEQVDSLLKSLHDDHGDFDDDAVLGRILRGAEPEAAVKEYQEHIKKLINTQKNPRPNPPTLGGQGQTVREQVDTSKLKNKRDRVNHVAALLRAQID